MNIVVINSILYKLDGIMPHVMLLFGCYHSVQLCVASFGRDVPHKKEP